MALPPHWLDEIFEDPSKARERFAQSERVAQAFSEASEAFEAQKEAYDKNPEWVGPTPARAASRAFLESLNQRS